MDNEETTNDLNFYEGNIIKDHDGSKYDIKRFQKIDNLSTLNPDNTYWQLIVPKKSLKPNIIEKYLVNPDVIKNVFITAAKIFDMLGYNVEFDLENFGLVNIFKKENVPFPINHIKYFNRMFKFWHTIGLVILTVILLYILSNSFNSSNLITRRELENDKYFNDYKEWGVILRENEMSKNMLTEITLNLNNQRPKRASPKVPSPKRLSTKKQKCLFEKGLNWVGNSCYQDAVFAATFAVPNDFINREILNKDHFEESKEISCGINGVQVRKNLQTELNNITRYMRGQEQRNQYYCTNLRKLLSNCIQQQDQQFQSNIMQDAGEFLTYLFKLFNVNAGVLHTDIETKYENDKAPVIIRKDKILSPIIPVNLLTNNNVINLQNIINDGVSNTTETDKKIYIQNVNYTNGEYIIFSVQRNLPVYDDKGKFKGTRVDNVKITAPPQLTISNEQLNLNAIVVHNNNHYTAYIRCFDIWYYYDDTKENLGEIADLNNPGANKPNPFTHGTLYYYNRS